MVGASRDVRGNGRLIFMVAHFPPPVSGMAVAVEALSRCFRERGFSVDRITIAGESLERSLHNHGQRIWRVCRALLALATHRKTRPNVYLSCDAGPGMVYTIVISGLARVLRLPLFIHHHSYAYVSSTKYLFHVLAKVAGPSAWHLVICDQMGTELKKRYPSIALLFSLPYGYAIEPPGTETRTESHTTLVIGHLSNLSEAKGLQLVFDTLALARKQGLPVRLLLAGPPAGGRDAALLDEGLRTSNGAAQYVGPVDKDEREHFLGDLDVFLFPTRYSHESFGLVAGEALAAGVPVLAYSAGCLTNDVVGEAGTLFDRSSDFAEQAVAELRRWALDPESLQRARVTATENFARFRHDSLQSVDTFCREVLHASGTDYAP